MQIQESMSVSMAGHLVWVILSILAQLAPLAQSYFSLIVSEIETYNCFGVIQTDKKNCNDLQWLKIKTWWREAKAYDFFSHGNSRHYRYFWILSNYYPCPTVRDCPAVYTALFCKKICATYFPKAWLEILCEINVLWSLDAMRLTI